MLVVKKCRSCNLRRPYADLSSASLSRAPVCVFNCRQGVKLESHYTQSVSSPSRAMIFSGRYPSHTGLGPQVIKPCRPYGLPVGESVLVESFQAAGYATHLVGKWHLGYCNKDYFPTKRGFDTWYDRQLLS